jgi:prepilin peptidase CpaA
MRAGSEPSLMSALVQIALASAFPILAIVAGLKDLISYTIPNWIPLLLLAAFTGLALTAGMPMDLIGLHLLVGAAALVAGMAMFALGWVGGGDAKLMAAACLWLGWPTTQSFLMDTALAGGALSVLLLLARGQLFRAFVPIQSGWMGRLVTPGEPAPYGVAIAIGALAAFPATELLGFIHTSY